MTTLSVLVSTDPGSRSRRATYIRQLRRRFRSHDASWQATIDTIQSLDSSRKLAKEQQFWETFMFLLAINGILCVSVEGELLGVELAQLVEEGKNYTSARETNSLSYSTLFIILKGVLSGTSGLLLFALIMRYRIVCKIKILAKQLPPDASFFSSYSGLRGRFLLETLLCTFHMPLLSVDRQIWRWEEYDIWCLDQFDVVVFARIYLLGRVLRNYVGLNSTSHHARFIGSIHQVDLSSIWLTIKFSFQKFPFGLTLVLLGIDWFFTSVALNFFERASNPTQTNASDAFWLTIVTITGVGYGDTFPWTLGGKIVIAIGGIIGGMVIACLLRVVLIAMLQMTPQEQTVLDVAQFYRYVRQRKESATVVIQQAWRWHLAKSAKSRQARNHKFRLYAAAEAFRLLRFTLPPILAANSSFTSSSSTSMTDIVSKRIECLQTNIEDRRAHSCNELKKTVDILREIAQSF